ncbi:MAG: phosphate acyltransferase [Myxococcota bacterium]|nr:phosphate acyltransferase [Myxococcota bacterium]
MNFDDIARRAATGAPKKIAVVGAHDPKILNALWRVAEAGIASGILIGDRSDIETVARVEKIDISAHDIWHMEHPETWVDAAMTLVKSGTVTAIMKGKITTAELMHQAIQKGLRQEGSLLTHVTAIEHPALGEDRLVLLTDAGLITFPTLEQRVQIIKNGVRVMQTLGIQTPNVAVLSISEEVNERVPPSVEAQKLKEMNAPGRPLHGFGIVDGPLDLFCAVDANIAALKGVSSRVTGNADILHCPNAVCGNLMSKAIIYFAKESRNGGCVVGGKVPVILLSRASSAMDKYCSILLGMIAMQDCNGENSTN